MTPDPTAVRVALWRALHLEVDAPPHVLTDPIGLQLAAPDASWRERPDMHPQGTRGYRASIVGRARFIEDLVEESHASQYVLLGAGLDTFAQRRPDLASRLRVFEIDRPETQAWKRERLTQLGYEIRQQLVPVDFERESWREKLLQSGFDGHSPAVVASTGVSMYLSCEANLNTLREISTLAFGSVFAMTFLLPLDLIDPAERAQHQFVYDRARAAGTPFVSFFRPDEILALAREAGFRSASHISRADLIHRYFASRPDGLAPSSGEEFLLATT